MYSTLGLFNSVRCPDGDKCKAVQCLFSHLESAGRSQLPEIPIGPSHAVAHTPQQRAAQAFTSPPKRSIAATTTFSSVNGAGSGSRILEPPSKLQKLDTMAKRSTARPSSSYNVMGVPILQVNPAQSKVALPVRQAMLKTLYEHFSELYSELLATNPSLPSDHALSQENDVYNSSTKLTYRNAMISSVAALKKRPKPNSPSHDSVGTELEIQRRQEGRHSLQALHLTREHLKPYLMSTADMKRWNYVLDIPDSNGGSRPSEEGSLKECERCRRQFVVKKMSEADQCVFHWGRPYTTRINGDKLRIFKCCSLPASDSDGCDKGPHVFSESDPEMLHLRHAFSPTRPANPGGGNDTTLDVVALDCEMIYSTGGVSVARVSVVDGSGNQIFDELVRMDDGVEVIDFNTRFSGVTEETYSKAVLTLSSIRRSLDAFIDSNTVMIGHSLDSDLKTLRMIHHSCIDTASLFPHRNGFPYRRALRDLVREHLNEIIQAGGGTVGHSSVEDAVATLNLVRWFILDKLKAKQHQSGLASAAPIFGPSPS